MVKTGSHSVGVAHQYCGQLGKGNNCQALVSLTFARNVPLSDKHVARYVDTVMRPVILGVIAALQAG